MWTFRTQIFHNFTSQFHVVSGVWRSLLLNRIRNTTHKFQNSNKPIIPVPYLLSSLQKWIFFKLAFEYMHTCLHSCCPSNWKCQSKSAAVLEYKHFSRLKYTFLQKWTQECLVFCTFWGNCNVQRKAAFSLCCQFSVQMCILFTETDKWLQNESKHKVKKKNIWAWCRMNGQLGLCIHPPYLDCPEVITFILPFFIFFLTSSLHSPIISYHVISSSWKSSHLLGSCMRNGHKCCSPAAFDRTHVHISLQTQG